MGRILGREFILASGFNSAIVAFGSVYFMFRETNLEGVGFGARFFFGGGAGACCRGQETWRGTWKEKI